MGSVPRKTEVCKLDFLVVSRSKEVRERSQDGGALSGSHCPFLFLSFYFLSLNLIYFSLSPPRISLSIPSLPRFPHACPREEECRRRGPGAGRRWGKEKGERERRRWGKGGRGEGRRRRGDWVPARATAAWRWPGGVGEGRGPGHQRRGRRRHGGARRLAPRPGR